MKCISRGRIYHVLCAHCFQRVVSLCRLSTQHNAVGPIQNSVSHVAALGTCGTGLFDHALQHLGTKDGEKWL